VTGWGRLSSVLWVAAALLLLGIGWSLDGQSGPVLGDVEASATIAWGWKAIFAVGGLWLAGVAALRRDPGVGWGSAFVLAFFVGLAGRSTPSISDVHFSAGSLPKLPEPSIVGWPLVFLIAGVATIAVALFSGGRGREILTRRPEVLAAGSLLLGVGVALTQVRMTNWSNTAHTIVVGVAFLVTLGFALAQPREGNAPSGATSLLSVLAVGYAPVFIVRGDQALHHAHQQFHTGTYAWLAAIATAVGAGLTLSRRSAGVALATLIGGGVTVVLTVASTDEPSITDAETALLVLSIAYVLLALVVRGWPRLSTVAGVAAGIAAFAIASAIYIQSLVTAISDDPNLHAPHVAWGWIAVMLGAIVATAFVAAWQREPGPAYVAGVLVAALIVIDALRLGGGGDTSFPPQGSLWAWPALLLIAGAALAASSLVPSRRDAR
jgi:hypothetical protein